MQHTILAKSILKSKGSHGREKEYQGILPLSSVRKDPTSVVKQLGWKDIQDPSHDEGQHHNQEQSEWEDTVAPKLPLLLVTK